MSEIRTVEELAALPVGTVLRTPGGVLIEVLSDRRFGSALLKYPIEHFEEVMRGDVLTVLYRPDLPTQDTAVSLYREAEAERDRLRAAVDAAAERSVLSALGDGAGGAS